MVLSTPLMLHAAEWTQNDDGYLLRPAQSTEDLLAINVCTQIMAFMSPSDAANNGKTAELQIKIRVDQGDTRLVQIKVQIIDSVALAPMPLDPELFTEILKGQALRVKWADHAYSRFDLKGFSAAARNVKCDQDYFPENTPKSDSDYFL